MLSPGSHWVICQVLDYTLLYPKQRSYTGSFVICLFTVCFKTWFYPKTDCITCKPGLDQLRVASAICPYSFPQGWSCTQKKNSSGRQLTLFFFVKHIILYTNAVFTRFPDCIYCRQFIVNFLYPLMDSTYVL